MSLARTVAGLAGWVRLAGLFGLGGLGRLVGLAVLALLLTPAAAQAAPAPDVAVSLHGVSVPAGKSGTVRVVNTSDTGITSTWTSPASTRTC